VKKKKPNKPTKKNGGFDTAARCAPGATKIHYRAKSSLNKPKMDLIGNQNRRPVENWRDWTAFTLGHMPALGRTPEEPRGRGGVRALCSF
jgi:hypothetical protein